MSKRRNDPSVMGFIPVDLPHAVWLRFMERVEVGREDGCWIWHGYVNERGYGRIVLDHATKRYAHRVAYTILRGPIPFGTELDHTCLVERCVNPWHLEPVSHTENVARMHLSESDLQRYARVEDIPA